MAFSTGFLKDRITILNRTGETSGKFGIDTDGISWKVSAEVWASVEWARGKSALNAGAVEAYAYMLVRMRWTSAVNMRSRITHNGKTYQIIPDTFHENRMENTIQFNAQLLVGE